MRALLVLACMILALFLAAAGARWASKRAGDSWNRRMGVAPSAPDTVFVPSFSLTERSGRVVTDAALKNQVWVAGFVFTRCPTVCPRMTRLMVDLQADLAELPGGQDARLVAISVDPEFDTPAVLSAHARGLGADPERFLFLTGDRVAIWRLAEQGFKLPVGAVMGEAPHPILHSQKLVVVDRYGELRGWFDPLDVSEQREALVRKVEQALAEPKRVPSSGSVGDGQEALEKD